MAFGYRFYKAFIEPTFKKLCVACMALAFDSVMLPIAKSPNDVHPLELPSAFYALNLFPPQRAPVFARQPGVDPALIDIYTLFNRNLGNLL